MCDELGKFCFLERGFIEEGFQAKRNRMRGPIYGATVKQELTSLPVVSMWNSTVPIVVPREDSLGWLRGTGVLEIYLNDSSQIWSGSSHNYRVGQPEGIVLKPCHIIPCMSLMFRVLDKLVNMQSYHGRLTMKKERKKKKKIFSYYKLPGIFSAMITI